MIDEIVTVRLGYLALQVFNVCADKFDDFPCFKADHMIVMGALIQFKDGSPAFEIMAMHEASVLELRQNAIHGRETNHLARLDELTVNVLCAEMVILAFLQQLQYLESWRRGLQAGLSEIVALHKLSLPIAHSMSYYSAPIIPQFCTAHQ